MTNISFGKRNRISRALISLPAIAVLLFSGLAYSGAWTGPQGAAYNKFGFNYFTSDEQLDGDGDSFDTGAEFTDFNFTYYGEYGFRDDLTFFGSVPLKSLEFDPDAGSSVDNTGIGDIDLGIRYNLYNEDWGLISVQGLVKIPSAYDEDEDVPLGNGQTDIEVRLLYGKSLWPKPMYLGAEIGYRFRDEEPSDEIKYLLEFGYTVNDKVSLRAKLDGTTSAKNADSGTDFAGNPTLAPDFDLGKLELTAGYTIEKNRFVEFTLTPVVYGRDTADGITLSVAYIWAIVP